MLPLLLRFWPYLAGIALIIGAYGWAHHAGYESGYAASEAKWQPAFAKAERERDAANARTRTMEESSTHITQSIEAEHADKISSLNLRVADADQRIRALGMRLAAASAHRCDVPEVSGATAVPDATTESVQRASEAGGRIARVGADCEADALSLTDLQRWVTEQHGIFNSPH